MKLEKRSSGDTEEPVTESAPRSKKPVIVYIMILFIVAFLLMALSFFMHQRSNTEALGNLQDSVTAMQEVQAIQEQVIDLQEELAQARKEIDTLKGTLEEQRSGLDEAQREQDALLALYTLQQQYSAGDYDACRQTLQSMDDQNLVELLPQEIGSDVTAPSQRYQQLKEAILNK